MAFDNIEIELKFRVTEALFTSIGDLLSSGALFKGEFRQIDHYFVPKWNNYLAREFPFEWLSIRERGDNSVLNYKHFHPEGAEVTTHCDEYECPISDPSTLATIFREVGIERVVIVDKTRKLYQFEDVEITMDSVQGLGPFIEIEATRKHGSIDGTRTHLNKIAERLRLMPPEAEVDYRGYPYLLWKANAS
jgi:adenylate cyclase class 2